MTVSAAQKAAISKHQAEKLDDIKLRPPKGSKDRWREAAAKEGKSLQRYIIDLVEKDIASKE
jgi:hypothetical protein